jgi:maleate isomerase
MGEVTEIEGVARGLVYDERPARWRIGVIALATDHTTERDFARMCPSPEVAVYVSRVLNHNPTTVENLLRMQPQLTEAASLILPDETLDAVAYGCTSGTVVIGEDAVTAAVQEAKPGVPCITPPAAACAAFEALEIRRISVLTPYTREVSEPFIDYFAERGLEVVNLSCLGLEDDRMMARLSLDSIATAARDVADPAAEGLFISCTAVRAAEVAGEIEEALGRPVVTSNQATVWRTLRAAGCGLPVPGHGRLLTL